MTSPLVNIVEMIPVDTAEDITINTALNLLERGNVGVPVTDYPTMKSYGIPSGC